MRNILLLVILTLTANSYACDSMQAWEARVNESDNPDAHARDMMTDWIRDHHSKIEALDACTLAKGEAIMEWMDRHGFTVTAKVCEYYREISKRLRASLRARITLTENIPATVIKAEIVPAPPKVCATGH